MEHSAIVIGGGLSGLATAQVLSKHFSSVVLIEKDEPQSLQGLSAVEAWRLGNKARPGVTQVSGNGSEWQWQQQQQWQQRWQQ